MTSDLRTEREESVEIKCLSNLETNKPIINKRIKIQRKNLKVLKEPLEFIKTKNHSRAQKVSPHLNLLILSHYLLFFYFDGFPSMRRKCQKYMSYFSTIVNKFSFLKKLRGSFLLPHYETQFNEPQI